MSALNITWLKNTSKSDAEKLGEKVAYLGELQKQKIPVPDAFIIGPDFFHSIMSEYNEQIGSLLSGISDFDSATKAANQIKTLFGQSIFTEEIKEMLLKNYRELGQAEHYKDIPEKTLNLISSGRDLPFVAIRASPTKVLPGLIKPVLNVYGIEALTNGIIQLLTNVFSPRALLYYRNKDINVSDLKVSLMVQKMINSKKCGDLFSINPIKNSKNEIYVQSMWGINNTYLDKPSISIFNKQSKDIVEEHIVSQDSYLTKNAQFGDLISEPLPDNMKNSAVLSKNELKVICDLATQIEKIMNFPQHIEWAVERNSIYALQTQPITRIMNKPLTVQKSTGENIVTQGIPIVAKSTSGQLITNPTVPTEASDNIILADAINDASLPNVIGCAGVITNSLGLTSNIAFACREFDIPCIVGVSNTNLKDGQKIEANSDGAISVVAEYAPPTESYSSYSETPSYGSEVRSEVYQPTSGSFEELQQHLIQLERHITKLVSEEAQRRASGENVSEADYKKSQLLSDLEWQIRSLRRKLEN